jgi:hypothetical protein
MAFPPPGHPHYMPDAEREAQWNRVAVEEEPIDMTPSPAQKKYQELRTKIAQARKTMEETAKGLFTEMSAELFNDNPTLESFGWTQYTPYWNDGDVCTFRCNGEYPTVSIKVDDHLLSYDTNRGELTIDGNEIESPDEHIRTFKSMGVDEFKKNGKTYAYNAKTNTVTVNGEPFPTYDEYEEQLDVLEKKVGKFMKNFEDEDMQVMFGDHMQVTVNRDGTVETEEYEHD